MFTFLPGITRTRQPIPYCYRLVHQASASETPGCLLAWEVLGGRDIYQVALERHESGCLRWHCTCPDAVYRGEGRTQGCKHVRGLKGFGRG
ncbi:MAG: hypothetical protein U0840_04545 [Gemmataceae bacterium]